MAKPKDRKISRTPANDGNTLNLPNHSLEDLISERSWLQELFMQAPAMIVILRGPEHTIELANPLYRSLIGNKNDLIGKPLAKALPNIEKQFVKLLDKVYKSGEAYTGNEVPVSIDRDGNGIYQEIFCNFVYQPIKNKDGFVEGIFAHGVEVTDQVLARRNLELSELRYRTMIEQSPLSVQVLNPEGYTIQVNSAWQKLWGAKLEDLKGYNMLHDKQLVASGTLKLIKKAFKGKVEFLPPIKYEPNKTLPGVSKINYRWVQALIYPVKDSSDAVKEVVIIHQDITPQKEVEEALQDSEESWRFLAESIPQKVFTANPDGEIDYYNPQWMEYTGLSLEEMKNWGLNKFVHEDDIEDSTARWQYSIQTGEPFAFEHRFRKHNGQYRWHISRARAMFDEDGSILKWYGSNTDIHDIKLALQREHELEVKAASLIEQREQLIQLNRAKDDFISLASHQLRTPASGVKQFIGMVLQEGFTDSKLADEHRRLLKMAYESNDREIQVIDDLLKVARVDAGNIVLKKVKVNFIPLIQDIIGEQSEKFNQRNQQIGFSYKLKDYTTEADLSKIRMVLENIIDNASKYTKPGKNVNVTIRKSKGYIEIAVTDEGVGIAKKDLDKIFNKFSRVDNELSILVGGTGLGLYWAKKIVDLHKGDIAIESKPGKGTTFTITLPII